MTLWKIDIVETKFHGSNCFRYMYLFSPIFPHNCKWNFP